MTRGAVTVCSRFATSTTGERRRHRRLQTRRASVPMRMRPVCGSSRRKAAAPAACAAVCCPGRQYVHSLSAVVRC